MNLYEQVFPYGGFRIFDPSDPERFEERTKKDTEFDSNSFCPDCYGSRLGYGTDNAGPSGQWYSNRREIGGGKNEETDPFYHLHQYDGPHETLENLGDSHKTEMFKDPSHVFSQDFLDNPDPDTWKERGWAMYLAHVNRAKMFRTICGFVLDCDNLKTLNKGYWRFRSLVDKKYANKVENRLFGKFLTTPQIRVVFEMFRSKQANLQKGKQRPVLYWKNDKLECSSIAKAH